MGEQSDKQTPPPTKPRETSEPKMFLSTNNKERRVETPKPAFESAKPTISTTASKKAEKKSKE